MRIKWTSAAMTHPGMRRKENQDALVYSPDHMLFSLADGMGGVAYGKKTAMIVSTMMTALARRLQPWEGTSAELAGELGRSISSISDNIQALGNPVGMRPSFGATLTGFMLHGDDAVVFNVGDSRVYRLAGGRLEAMTVDHSVAQILVESGEMTPEEARLYPGRSTVTRFMGMHPTVLTDVRVVPVQPGDTWLVCSDGLHSMVSDSGIQAILERPDPLEALCEALIAAANSGGGEDNISLVLLRAEENREAPESPENQENGEAPGEENAGGDVDG